jgi:hypothetical protein
MYHHHHHHLLPARRAHHTRTHVQRFDPRLWTINFPRPMMASVVSIAADALRVTLNPTHRDQIAGLIWESADRHSHPILSYDTARDYRDCTLSFRWKSGGVRALDAVNGPVLTIEGRDADGALKSWYVRLWNYATGSPNDCHITLPFGDLNGGFLLPEQGDPVFAGDIDRMFIALSAADFDDGPDAIGAATAHPDGWAELSDIRCTGEGAMLPIGDALAPCHGLSIATGYDDLYHQTPARIIDQIAACGYTGSLVHYVGMSHFMRLSTDGKVATSGDPLNTASAAWHADLFARAKAAGLSPIASLSYELFAQYAPPAWMQRASNGDAALTGWVPPSTLLSPASNPAMAWLQTVAVRFVELMQDAGCAVRFQVGEPWWWTDAAGRIYLYDDAAKATFVGDPVVIHDVGDTMTAAQTALLDDAGALLASSTAALCAAVKAAEPTSETLLLAYLPTILDAARPEVERANLPVGWASPAFDTLQLEDYDWAATGALALSEAGVAAATARLQYPLTQTHYFAGFVLNPADAARQWPQILSAADAAVRRGHAQVIMWAWPQVARDGLLLSKGTKHAGF